MMITELRIFVLECAKCGKAKRTEATDKEDALSNAKLGGWWYYKKDCPIYCPDCKSTVSIPKGE